MWRYAIPLAFYSDRHSIFTPVGDYRTLKRNYQLTDYERLGRHLGIETIYAQTPQAKGRIGRLNKTLQGRWPHQFAYEGITNIEQANANIDRFFDDYNEEFSVKAREITDAHIPFGQNREQLIESVPVGVRRAPARGYLFHKIKNALGPFAHS